MKISTTRAALLPAVKRAASIADGSITPMLGGALLRASTGRLDVIATNLTVEASAYIPAKAGKNVDGAVVVDAKMLAGIVGRLPDGDVAIATTKDDKQIEIVAGRVKATVGVVARADDFPAIAPAPDGASDLDFDAASAFALMLASAAPAICTDETRFQLAGVMLERVGLDVRAVATDGHRLIVASHDFDLFPDAQRVIVPRAGVEAIRALLAVDADFGVSVAIAERRITVVRATDHGTTHLVVKLIDAAFPPYEQVIPKHKHHVNIDRAALADAIKRGALMTDDTHGVSLAFDGSTCTVSAHRSDVGQVVEEIEIESTLTGALTIGAAPKYLADALGVITADSVRVDLGGPLEPIMLTPSDSDDLIAVVMPMRL